jgi:ribosomal protein S18 acetylase RimI-like enzyme
MELTARPATEADLDELVRLYRRLEKEMVALKEVWGVADGLPEPVEAALKDALSDPEALVYVGEVESVPVGFVLVRSETLLPQAGGERVGSVRFIFTEPEARGVGVGEMMLETALGELRRKGMRRFDAHVPPGHRDAKNFFEAAGFSARSITMYHEDLGGLGGHGGPEEPEGRADHQQPPDPTETR